MKKLTKKEVLADIAALPENYKTRHVDALIKRYVKEGCDVSDLRDSVLSEQRLHRIYYYTSLKQLHDPSQRLRFIDENLLFSDWWHTDQLINFVSKADFNEALSYAKRYVEDEDPFVRRWGYVMFISKLCRDRGRVGSIFSLMKNDDEYYVQMAQAWLIAELAVFHSEEAYEFLSNEGTLRYSITGKAIQKICDSFRVSAEDKQRFRALRPALKAQE